MLISAIVQGRVVKDDMIVQMNTNSADFVHE